MSKSNKNKKPEYLLPQLFEVPQYSLIHITVEDLESLLNITLLLSTFTIAFAI